MEIAFFTVDKNGNARYITADFDHAWPIQSTTIEAAKAELIKHGYGEAHYLETEAFATKVEEIKRITRLGAYKFWTEVHKRRGWSADLERINEAIRNLELIGISKEEADQLI